MMLTTVSEPTPPSWANEELRYRATQIKGFKCASLLWRRLTPTERNRLGGDLRKAYNRSRITDWWIELHGVSFQRAVLDVAKKISLLDREDYECLLREIGESTDVDEAIRMAIEISGLVLVERPRTVYWRGKKVEADFHRYSEPWEFIWELARHGKAGQPVDRDTFNKGADAVAKLKHRLTSIRDFPIELDDAIKVVGRGTQQLQLPPEQIRIFELKGLESLGEWIP